MKLHSRIIIFIYFTGIFVFALMFCTPGATTAASSFWNNLYFSVITITTLGYGDIQPLDGVGRTLASIETLFGIICIGLFLSCVWNEYASKIQKYERALMHQEMASKELMKMKRHSNYLFSSLSEYLFYFHNLFTSIGDEVDLDIIEFKFSSLRSIYDPPLTLIDDLYTTKLESFFNIEKKLYEEIRFFTIAFDLTEHQDLHDNCLDLLSFISKNICRGALLSYKNNADIKKSIIKVIGTHDSCPDIKDYPHNAIIPVIMLYNNITSQYTCVKNIIKKLQQATQ